MSDCAIHGLRSYTSRRMATVCMMGKMRVRRKYSRSTDWKSSNNRFTVPFASSKLLGVRAAYAAGHALKVWGVPTELGLLLGVLSGAALGFVMGALAIRRSGIYFSMITLALAEMLYFYFLQAKFTGGEDGLQGVPRGALLGVISLKSDLTLYFFVLAIFAWALGGFANIYYGLGQRMLELSTEHVKKQSSVELTRSKAYHPEVQRGVADMVMELEAIGAQVEAVTSDWSNGIDHGPSWPIKLIALKYRAVEGAWRVADTALDVSGGFGMFKKSEMERLFRDARCGRFHPANSALAHELIGKMALGINPDETPRWG